MPKIRPISTKESGDWKDRVCACIDNGNKCSANISHVVQLSDTFKGFFCEYHAEMIHNRALTRN